jgi:acyl carrier protein
MATEAVARKERTLSRTQDNAITGELLLPLVLGIAQSILGQPVQPSDNFFLLGGDSMRAVEMINTLEDHLGAELDPTSIIDAEDMNALAISLRDQLREL